SMRRWCRSWKKKASFRRKTNSGLLAPSRIMQTKKAKSNRNASKPKCGLCRKSRNLMKVECCDNWICDDEHKYAMFSYARNSCHRNHSHYTLCAHHHNEQHSGKWQECMECKSDFA